MIEKVVVTFFDVGRGDATLFEIYDDEDVYFVVYDTCKSAKSHPLCDYLKDKTDTIHAIIISHFHRDHTSGISELFDNFEVKELYIPPYLHSKTTKIDDILAKYRLEIKQKTSVCTDEEELTRLSDFTRIIHEVHKFCKGKSKLYIDALEGVEKPFFLDCHQKDLGKVYLPLKDFNNNVAKSIEDAENCLDVFSNMNDSSVAILFEFFNRKLLMTGDSQKRPWYLIKGKLRNRLGNFNLDVLKVAHHGSKYNTDEDLLKFYFNRDDNKKKYAVISGDGKKHPSKELLAALDDQEILPLCTGLSGHCVPKEKLIMSMNISSYFTDFLINYDISDSTKCQGNITIALEENSLEIKTEKSGFCPYHL